jgi:predicted RNA-binding Zn ribbon-like protein
MPEHREGTPRGLEILESFLWHDFGAGPADWMAWVQRKMPDMSGKVAAAAFDSAMDLHAALRSLQAANTEGDALETAPSHKVLDRLIVHHGIRPSLDAEGAVRLVPRRQEDPIGPLVIEALEAMQSGVWRRFKLCREPTCRASYYDASKAAAKTWCSMETCGSRNKMRRYRAK